MKNKLLSFIFTFCLIVPCALLLGACSLMQDCTWETEWSSSSTHHWHACTNPDCEEVSDKETHTLSQNWNVNKHWQECEVCGKILDAESHSITKQEYNDTHHWYACTAGCTVYAQKEPHNWNEGVVTKQPTAQEDGVLTYTCDGCDIVK